MRRYGERLTDTERRARHLARYGTTVLPSRGSGLRNPRAGGKCPICKLGTLRYRTKPKFEIYCPYCGTKWGASGLQIKSNPRVKCPYCGVFMHRLPPKKGPYARVHYIPIYMCPKCGRAFRSY